MNAGPFSDLIQLRRFEELLAGVGTVSDVRVRRFSKGRAEIQVGVTDRWSLPGELQRAEPGLALRAGEGAALVVDLPDPEAEQDGPSDGAEGGQDHRSERGEEDEA